MVLILNGGGEEGRFETGGTNASGSWMVAEGKRNLKTIAGFAMEVICCSWLEK